MSDDTTAAEEREKIERAEFQVGGIDREMPPEQQLSQLSTYIAAHYDAPDKNPPWSDNPSDPEPADTFDARLPDRITHSAMLMLGAAVDHAMPGVAFPGNVAITDVPELNAQLFSPSRPLEGKWAISLHPGGWWKGSGVALENAWRPEVAGVAELSGVTILDLDYPLVPEHTLPEVISAVADAAAWARAHGATSLGAWGYSSGGALAVLASSLFDALALTFPHLDLSLLPESVRGGIASFPDNLPPTFLQVATHDVIADRYVWAEAQATVKEYVSEHRISTPTVARDRVTDVAEFLRNQL